MDSLAPIIGFLVVAAVIIGVLIWTAAHTKQLNATYHSLAQHYRGRLHEGGWTQLPSVTFDHRGSWVRVDIYSTGGKHSKFYTQVHMGWAQPNFRMEVYPEGILQSIGKTFLGMTDVEIGVPDFDRNYIITGSSQTALRDLLNPRVRLAINALRDLTGNHNIYVAVRNYELLIKKLGLIKDPAVLRRFVELSLVLYDAAIPEADAGIEFVDAPAESNATRDAAVCQICGEEIRSDLVKCRSCKTPHHHDCWRYIGQCSTFGCGETRCYRPRAKSSSRRR